MLAAITVFLFGISVGSFLNVCIYRIPRRKSIISPPSACPSCNTKIQAKDNIPLVSYLLLKGKCRTCGGRISPQYPLIEGIAGLIALALYWLYIAGVWGEAPAAVWKTGEALIILYLLLVIVFIDVEFRSIPDSLIISGFAAGICYQIAVRMMSWFDFIGGFIIGGAGLFLIALLGRLLFRRESLGGGDIKLGAMLGIFLGIKGVIVGIVTAFFFAMIVGGGGKLLAGKKPLGEIPFAPYLAFGGIIGLFLGNKIADLYLSWIGI